jgi:ABC-2 type transport system ATP-binding protein
VAAETAVLLDGARVSYGRARALDGFDLGVAAGAVHGLLGRNGAGKTTTIRALAGLVRLSGGSARVLGEDPSSPAFDRRRLSVLPAGDGFVNGLTLAENLVTWAGFWGIGREAAGRAASEVLGELSVGGLSGRQVKALSTGSRRMAALARTFMVPADVFLLDEPTSSLDPVSAPAARDFIRRRAAGRTVVLSTHNLQEAEELCSSVTIIDAGRTAFSGGPTGGGGWLVRTEDGSLSAGGRDLRPDASGMFLVDLGLGAADTLALLTGSGARVTEFRPASRSLAELFREVVGG